MADREKKPCKVCGYVRMVRVHVDVRRDWDVNHVKPDQKDLDDFVGRCVSCRGSQAHLTGCPYYVEPPILSETPYWEDLCEMCDLRERARKHMRQAAAFMERANKIEDERLEKGRKGLPP